MTSKTPSLRIDSGYALSVTNEWRDTAHIPHGKTRANPQSLLDLLYYTKIRKKSAGQKQDADAAFWLKQRTNGRLSTKIDHVV
jgi:hypothetical protein